MNELTVKIKKLGDGAIVPTFGSEFAAGADLYSAEETLTVAPGETKLIGTKLAMAIPEGKVGLIYARSGLSVKKGLAPANKVGVIDSDYRGEISVGLVNLSQDSYTIQPGDRIAQLMVTPVVRPVLVQAEELDETDRGAGGFGSTGR